MHQAGVRRRGVLAVALLGGPWGLAKAAVAGAPATGLLDAAETATWLARIHRAAQSGNYQGILVVSAVGTLSSSRVWHYAVADQVYEQLEALDGRQQRISRHNDLVQTEWPQTRTAVIEKRETPGAWSTTPLSVQPQAGAQYGMRREADGRVAGRDAAVLLLEPRDALRHGQRLWVDLASGLLLRADVLGSAGASAGGPPQRVLESTAFSELALGVKPQPEAVLQALKGLQQAAGWRIIRPQQQRTSLDAEGWGLVHPVPGFALASCVRRGMDASGDDSVVLQAVFGDGLTHVSVFVERYNAGQARTEMQAQHGATSALSLRRGDDWITVVGDVPPAALKVFAQALERRQP